MTTTTTLQETSGKQQGKLSKPLLRTTYHYLNTSEIKNLELAQRIEAARNLAIKWHYNQYRRDGVTPYFDHLQTVADAVPREYKAVAYLHDLLEDTYCSIKEMQDAGISNKDILSVMAMTKLEEEYEEYLRRVNADPVAKAVKIQDILHNKGDKPTKKQEAKYLKALQYFYANP